MSSQSLFSPFFLFFLFQLLLLYSLSFSFLSCLVFCPFNFPFYSFSSNPFISLVFIFFKSSSPSPLHSPLFSSFLLPILLVYFSPIALFDVFFLKTCKWWIVSTSDWALWVGGRHPDVAGQYYKATWVRTEHVTPPLTFTSILAVELDFATSGGTVTCVTSSRSTEWVRHDACRLRRQTY